MNINQDTALFVFIVILIVALLIALSFGDFQSFDASWFHSFILILIGLGIFITFIFYYAVAIANQQSQQLSESLKISKINNDISNIILNEMEKSCTIIPNFISSINPLSSTNNMLTSDPDISEANTAKIILSTRIFMIWEDILIIKRLTKADELSYLTDFLQRANSKQLHELWKIGKINYNESTQIYGDLLFEYGLQIIEQKPDLYVSAAKKMLEDERYKKLF